MRGILVVGCYGLIARGLALELLGWTAEVCQNDLASTYALHSS